MMQNNLSKLIRIARIIGDLFIFTLRFLFKFYINLFFKIFEILTQNK